MFPLYCLLALCLTVASECVTDTTGATDASQGTCLLQAGKGMRRTATASEEAEFQNLVSQGQKRMSLESHKDCLSMLRPHLGAHQEELLHFCKGMKYPSGVCDALRSAVGDEPLTHDRMEDVCKEVSRSVALLHRSSGISKASSAEAYGEALEWSLFRKSSSNATSANETAELGANETAEPAAENATEATEAAEPANGTAPTEANATAANASTTNETGNASLMSHKHQAHHKHHAAHKDKAHHKNGGHKHKGGHHAAQKNTAHQKQAKH